MATIVKGGAYQQPDGSWKDAKGRPIAAPRGDVYERPEEELLTADEVTPGAGLLFRPGDVRISGDPEEYAAPEDELESDDPSEKAKVRRVTKKQKS